MNNIIVVCPNCKIRVLPKPDGTCPGCQRDLSRPMPSKRNRPLKDSATTTEIVHERPAYSLRKHMEARPQPLSPVFSIWVRPRETIRYIVETNPTKHVIPLSMLAGVSAMLLGAAAYSVGDSIPFAIILAICILGGPVSGIVSLYIEGELFRGAGNWLGGHATSEEVRAAIAWSSVPGISILFLWIPKLLIFGQAVFSGSILSRMDAGSPLGITFIGFTAIEIAIGTWAWVIWLKSLGEVHGFSAWRAWGAYLLASFVFILPVVCIAAFVIVVF